jgi:hypothetical protein
VCEQAPLARGARLVVAHPLLRHLFDQGRHLGREILSLPDLEQPDGAAEPLDQVVRDRLMREHARRGRAFLPGVGEG